MSQLTAVIVQARMMSARLPGKVLLPLAGKSVLWHVLTRCRAIPGVNLVCCAVPDTKESADLLPEIAAAGAVVARGRETDVLARFQAAARQVGADIIVRVNSNCPLVDPLLCSRVLAQRAVTHADYGCNNMPRTWPQGLDCEVFTAAALERAANEATDPYDREHVTPWLRRADDIARINVPGPGGRFADRRWLLEYPEDYAFFSALFGALPPPPHVAGTIEIDTVLRRHPEIAALNAGRGVSDLPGMT